MIHRIRIIYKNGDNVSRSQYFRAGTYKFNIFIRSFNIIFFKNARYGVTAEI